MNFESFVKILMGIGTAQVISVSMRCEGEDFVSIHEFVENICQPDKDQSFSSILNEFCTLLTSKYSYEGTKCLKAEAMDKTRHILLPLSLVLEIFLSENIRRMIMSKNFSHKLNEILKIEYSLMDFTCCCCPKKLKKAVSRASAFTDFVRQGEVELRRFNALKSNIKFLICLDIEAYEHSTDKLLEFGISIYDMQWKTTTNTHIIVSDYLHLKNGKFVANNRDKFNFGQSLSLNLKTALEHVLAVLSTPNSCLIGHNIKADINFLKNVSARKMNMPPIFDTQLIYKQATLGSNMLGLIRVLDEIGIPHSNLHNAGNDAYYTLEIFKLLAKL